MRAIERHKKLPSIEGDSSNICNAFALKSVRHFYLFRYSYCKIEKIFVRFRLRKLQSHVENVFRQKYFQDGMKLLFQKAVQKDHQAVTKIPTKFLIHNDLKN